ncbi:hypothetical protein PIB30_034699 [Stylosanthes scabra]|uniref:Uncharacterized protein n=1 Tax=Stylosanthes scabra TaxID=79078 RepID=A0ABU6TDZ2_9FABA|nr:hypothetical protein [Stylosanthes scabra]
MNWARHVCSFLLDGITEMRWKKSKGVEGCVFALLIIYLHETRFGEDSEDDEARPPWLSYWRGDTLKERLKLEKKDSTWLYVLDVTHRKFYVLDSKNSEAWRWDRNKLNRFVSNVLDQIRVHAEAETMFPRMTRNMVTHSLFPKYITIPKQPNA